MDPRELDAVWGELSPTEQAAVNVALDKIRELRARQQQPKAEEVDPLVVTGVVDGNMWWGKDAPDIQGRFVPETLLDPE